MKRTMLCMFGLSLFVAMRAPAQERPSSSPTGATIVRIATFANQTGAIPETTVFTPTADGFFRASVFGEVLVTNPSNPASPTGFFCPDVSFTDDSGAPQNANGIIGAIGYICVPIVGVLTNSSASAMYFFRAKANTPITFSTALMYGGAPVAPYEYNVYVVLERF